MAIVTIWEIIDIIIVTLVLGYIFMSQFRRPRTALDVLDSHRFNFEDFKFAVLVTAPGIIFHEMAHKFVALSFGIAATFKAWYFGLGIGVFLSIINSPFILLAPGYVEIAGGTYLQQAASAFAGPFTNLVLFLVAKYMIERKKRFTRTQALGWHMTKQINIFLFFFNMIPIPPFDGSKVFYAIFKLFF